MRALLTTCGAALAVAVVACATSPRTAPGADGGAAYRSRCAACHRLYPPGERTRVEWAGVLDRMAPRAHLSGGEREEILRHLSAHARDGEAPAR